MCRYSFASVGAMLLFPVLVQAQMKQDTRVNMAQALTKPKIENVVSLIGLDPTRFSMRHSYSLSFGTSAAGSYNVGLYLNTMRYRLSDPLTVHLQFGLQHSPMGGEFGNGVKSQVFISSAGMEFKPAENLKLQLEFSQRPNSYYYYNTPFFDPVSSHRSSFDNEDQKEEGRE